jgi:VanZ family protein
VSRSNNLASSWLPVVLCLGLIFGASTDLMSSGRTSRFIGPVLRWFHPGINEQAVRQVQLGVRKGAHVAEYAVLALLLYRAVRRTRQVPPERWCGRCAGWALGIALLYAVSDEWHQSFVPSRDGTLHDVIIDGTGASLGLLLLYRWHLWRQMRELRPRN